MSERLRSMSDEDLGAALSALDLAWPPTPALRASGHGLAPRRAAGSSVSPCPAPADPADRGGDRAPAGRRCRGGEDRHRPRRRSSWRSRRAVPGSCRRRSSAPTGESITSGSRRRCSGETSRSRATRSSGWRLGRRGLRGSRGGGASHAGVASAPGLPEISETGFGAVLMVFEGDANLASKDALRGHRRAADRDGRRGRVPLDHGHAPPRAAHERRRRRTCASRATCSCGGTVRTRCAWRPPCRRPRSSGSPPPREPLDASRCSRGIGRQEGSI